MQRKKWLLGFLVAAIAALVGAGAVLAAAPSAPAPSASAQGSGQAATSTRPYLGAELAPVTLPIAHKLGLPDDHGALVVQVVPDSPAAQGGLKKEDVIRVINGQTIYTLGDAISLIEKKAPGDVLQLSVLRRGQDNQWAAVNVNVTLGEKPKPPAPLPLPLDRLAGLLPRLIQGDLQVLGPDNQPVHLTVTPGTVISATSTSATSSVLTIQRRDSQQAQFTVPPEAVILKRGHKVSLDDLKAGDPVVVMQQEGQVIAVIAGPFPVPPQPRVGPKNPRGEALDRMEERLENRLEKARERVEERLEKHREQAEERLEKQLEKRMDQMEKRRGR